MTYEEALKVQKTFPNPYLHIKTLCVALIVPNLLEDRNKYLNYLSTNSPSEESVKKFSTDGHFSVEAFDASNHSL